MGKKSLNIIPKDRIMGRSHWQNGQPCVDRQAVRQDRGKNRIFACTVEEALLGVYGIKEEWQEIKFKGSREQLENF